jgi:hypothetical protein
MVHETGVAYIIGLGRGHGGEEDLEVWASGDVCGGEGATWLKPGREGEWNGRW